MGLGLLLISVTIVAQESPQPPHPTWATPTQRQAKWTAEIIGLVLLGAAAKHSEDVSTLIGGGLVLAFDRHVTPITDRRFRQLLRLFGC